MGSRGRHREAIYDIEKLINISGRLDLEILVIIEKWLDGMEYSEYRKVKKVIKKSLEKHSKKSLTEEETELISWFLGEKLKEKTTDIIEYYGFILFYAMVKETDYSYYSMMETISKAMGIIKEKEPDFFKEQINCYRAKREEEKKPKTNIIQFPKRTGRDLRKNDATITMKK